uniref:Uncharacterized protein n=1 Tax=Oryza sativa subsp. japonica TaxID=39947 RepID=Q69MC7_ORYSJ|nr:hypothetical protein [Oryza sativa Japonica Group]
MGHPHLRAGPARPDGWWAVPGWEAQPMGRHGPTRSADRAVPARWLVGRAWPCRAGQTFWSSIEGTKEELHVNSETLGPQVRRKETLS